MFYGSINGHAFKALFTNYKINDGLVENSFIHSLTLLNVENTIATRTNLHRQKKIK